MRRQLFLHFVLLLLLAVSLSPLWTADPGAVQPTGRVESASTPRAGEEEPAPHALGTPDSLLPDSAPAAADGADSTLQAPHEKGGVLAGLRRGIRVVKILVNVAFDLLDRGLGKIAGPALGGS